MNLCDTDSTGEEMRVLFERLGGFAGMRISTSIATSDLAPEEAEILRHEVAQASFFNLPQEISPTGNSTDRFHYRITVETRDQAHTVEAPESAITEGMQPLVQHLMDLARRR